MPTNLACEEEFPAVLTHLSSGVASVAIRSLAIAAECLTSRREQEEVLQILDKIRQETGWRVAFINTELKKQWGWPEDPPPQQQSAPQQQLPTPNMSAAQMPYAAAAQAQAQAAQAQAQAQAQANAAAAAAGTVQPQATTLQPMPTLQQPTAPNTVGGGGNSISAAGGGGGGAAVAAAVSRPRLPSGILNPMLAAADFSMPQHPYQSYYVAPNSISSGWAFNT